jgi:hypothetical protein
VAGDYTNNVHGAADIERDAMIVKWMIAFDRIVFDTINYRQACHIDQAKMRCDELADIGISSPKGLDDNPDSNQIKQLVIKNCYSLMSNKFFTELGDNYHCN